MKSEVLPVFKNDRYKILKTEEEDYFLIDTDDKKLAFIHSYLALFGQRKGYRLTKAEADDLSEKRPKLKNANNKIFVYCLILALVYYIIAHILIFNLYLGYNSVPFWIFYISYLTLSPVMIKLWLPQKEKQQLKVRVKLDSLNEVTLKLKSETTFQNKIKLILITPIVQWGFPIFSFLVFSPLLDTPLELIIFPIFICAFISLVGNRSAFTNKYTKIVIEEVN